MKENISEEIAKVIHRLGVAIPPVAVMRTEDGSAVFTGHKAGT
jgi:hypothetical protein